MIKALLGMMFKSLAWIIGIFAVIFKLIDSRRKNRL